MKGLYWLTGSVVAGQLIYTYNENIGWLYAAYFVANLILTDLFSFDYRKPEIEAAVLVNYMVIAVGIAAGTITTSLAMTLLLIPAGVYNVWLAFRGYTVFRNPEYFHCVSARNQAIVEKKSVFMNVFFSLIGIISITGLIMGLF
jgi:hypothetical protein